MFFGEELKAKALPVELCMIGDVIFQSYRPGRPGQNLKQATESTRGGKTVNVKKSEHLLE